LKNGGEKRKRKLNFVLKEECLSEMQKSTALFLYLLAAQKFPVKMGTEI